MRVLVACEFSGIVRDAFLRLGHDAVSCDLVDTESPGPHITGDVRRVLDNDWDLMIAHPPCSHLSISGSRWFKDKPISQKLAIEFARALFDAPVPRIAIEQPVSILSTLIRKPDQVIHPYDHGHPETKRTCLWLKNLPLLQPSVLSFGRNNRVYMMPDRSRRSIDRSRTYPGIAKAMAEQWGSLKCITLSPHSVTTQAT